LRLELGAERAMENVVADLGQHLAQHLGMGPAGILGLRQHFQEGGDLRVGAKPK
jgi:hypothetical protein